MDEIRNGLAIIAFADATTLHAWLAQQPRDHQGIWLKLAKKGAGVASISQREAVDAGLCHGWIDGLINKFCDRFYLLRFTPRRPRSKWSMINRERTAALIEAKLMRPAGLVEIEAARADGRWDAAYAPPSQIEVPDDLQAALNSNAKAAAFFTTLTGANRYAILYRITSVKRADTRARNIAKFLAMLERCETVY